MGNNNTTTITTITIVDSAVGDIILSLAGPKKPRESDGDYILRGLKQEFLNNFGRDYTKPPIQSHYAWEIVQPIGNTSIDMKDTNFNLSDKFFNDIQSACGKYGVPVDTMQAQLNGEITDAFDALVLNGKFVLGNSALTANGKLGNKNLAVTVDIAYILQLNADGTASAAMIGNSFAVSVVMPPLKSLKIINGMRETKNLQNVSNHTIHLDIIVGLKIDIQ